MRKHPAVILLLAAVFTAAGCSTKPVDRYYTLDWAPPRRAGGDTIPLVLKVRTFRSAEILRQERVVRRLAPNEVTYYDTHRWAAPVERMVSERALEVLRAHGAFAQVLPYASAARPDLTLSGEVLALEEQVVEGRRTAVVGLRCRLTRHPSDERILDEEFSRSCPVEGAGAGGAVRSLGRCLQETLLEVAEKAAAGARNIEP